MMVLKAGFAIESFLRPDTGKCLHYYFYFIDPKYGLRLEPLDVEDLKSLRRQAEDSLRKDLSALPHRLSVLLRGSECYPYTINILRLPRRTEP